jgi:hypothetical protein
MKNGNMPIRLTGQRFRESGSSGLRFTYLGVLLSLFSFPVNSQAPETVYRFDLEDKAATDKIWKLRNTGAGGKLERNIVNRSDGSNNTIYCVSKDNPFGESYFITTLRGLEGRYRISATIETTGVERAVSTGWPAGQSGAVVEK